MLRRGGGRVKVAAVLLRVQLTTRVLCVNRATPRRRTRKNRGQPIARGASDVSVVCGPVQGETLFGGGGNSSIRKSRGGPECRCLLSPSASMDLQRITRRGGLACARAALPAGFASANSDKPHGRSDQVVDAWLYEPGAALRCAPPFP